MRSRSASARNPSCPAAAAQAARVIEELVRVHGSQGKVAKRRGKTPPWGQRLALLGLTPELQEEVESGSLKAGPSYWPDAQGGAGGRAAEAEGPPRPRKLKGAGRTASAPTVNGVNTRVDGPVPGDLRVTAVDATSLRGRPVHRSAPPSEDSLCRFRPRCTSLGKSSSRRAPGGIQGADPRSEQARPDSNRGPSGHPPVSCGKVQASLAAAVVCPICSDVTAETGLEILTRAMSPDRGKQRRSVAGFTRRHV